MSNPQRKTPGFLVGFTEVFRAVGFVARTPPAWPLALVPAVLFALIASAAALAAMTWLTPWVLSLLPSSDSAWMTVAEWLTRIVMVVASLLVGTWTALFLTPALSGPALEGLVAIQERALLIPERPPSGFLRDLWIGAKAQSIAVCFALPILLVLWLVGTFVPLLSVVTTPLQAMVTALALAWNLFDYPLTLRGVPAADRLGFVGTHWRPLFGFGLAFSALFWVPCFGILMLPVGVVAATRLLYLLLQADPAELSALPRPEPVRLPSPSAFDPLRPASRSSVEVGDKYREG